MVESVSNSAHLEPFLASTGAHADSQPANAEVIEGCELLGGHDSDAHPLRLLAANSPQNCRS